jgi:ABC-type Zn uptake system ZnuABC Zn-binding protein ZnuA
MFKTKTSNLDKEEFKTLIKKNIMKINNLDLIILKGHLLIEFLINKFLQSHSDDETLDISKENFQFHQS